MTVTRIALVGIGKIARDQHVPTIAASDSFELVAAITGHEPPEGVPDGAKSPDQVSETKSGIPVSIAVGTSRMECHRSCPVTARAWS